MSFTRIMGLVLVMLASAGPLACIHAQEPKKADPAAAPKLENGMVRLAPDQDAFLDPVNKRVVLKGHTCLREGQLEMMVTLIGTKEHEAVVAVKTKAFLVHAALLGLGAESGSPVRFQPKYVPASGTEVEVTFEWTDPAGVKRTVRAQEWARNVKTQQEMTFPFVFGGSGFYVDETTKQRHYLAEEGDFVCVSNFPTAMLDVPVQSSQGNDSLLFEVFTERMPPAKTPVTVYLTPKLKKKDDKKAEEKPAEKKAAEKK